MGLDGDYEIIARGPLRLHWTSGVPRTWTPEQRRRIDGLWEAAVAQSGGRMYDAPILFYQGHETAGGETIVRGVYASYRYFFAHTRRDDLGERVRPIGVSGLTLIDVDATPTVVLGRRGRYVSHYAERLECVPSGGMDDTHARPDGTVDYLAMLLQEFEEEVGLPAARVTSVSPLGLIYDCHGQGYDLCCRLHVAATVDELRLAAGASEEYVDLMFVPRAEVPACLERYGPDLIPVSRALLRLWAEL